MTLTPLRLFRSSLLPFIAALCFSLGLSACGGGASVDSVEPAMSPPALLGEKIFEDSSLSASGKLACASCHDAALGHASPFDTPVAFGGENLDQPGTRTPPTLRYLKFNTPFAIQADGTPSGGFNWDGRTNSLSEQARRPFLSANEMANTDAASVIQKISASSYAGDFQKTFGVDIFKNPALAFDRVVFALERYQKEDPDFAPFDSKFDFVLAGRASFSEAEQRGLALFNRQDKGNCAACHPSTKPSNAPAALFTDFTFDSLGLPRQNSIAANAVVSFFDLGLCGPVREDLSQKPEACGKFKVPTLRNVALRKRFFHNGAFDSLEQVIRFYVTRDTQAPIWYPSDASGVTQIYNDLPEGLRGNVNVSEAPYNRRLGEVAALNASEIKDLLSFLGTLSDGYKP